MKSLHRQLGLALLLFQSTSNLSLYASEIGASASGGPAVTTQTNSDSATKRKLFLFKATHNNQTIYLLARTNLRLKYFYPLEPEIENAFKESKNVFPEFSPLKNTNIYKVAGGKFAAEHNRAATSKSKYFNLSTHTSTDVKKALNDYLSWSGESSDVYEPYSLPSALIAIDHSISVQDDQFGPDIEDYMSALAQKSQKKVNGLKSLDERMGLCFSEQPSAAQDDLVTAKLVETRQKVMSQPKIQALWLAADPDAYYQRMTDDLKCDSAVLAKYKNILAADAATTVANIEQKISDGGPHLVIATALLFGGDRGMLKLLKEKGFTVEQVNAGTTSASVATQESKTDTIEAGIAGKLMRVTPFGAGFSMLVPRSAEKTSRMTRDRATRTEYSCIELPGSYLVSYGKVPNYKNLPKAQVDANISKAIKMATAYQLSKDVPWTLPGGAVGRKAQIIGVKGDPAISTGEIRMFCAGPQAVTIVAAGTKEWFTSPAVTQFLNSFTLTSPVH